MNTFDSFAALRCVRDPLSRALVSFALAACERNAACCLALASRARPIAPESRTQRACAVFIVLVVVLVVVLAVVLVVVDVFRRPSTSPDDASSAVARVRMSECPNVRMSDRPIYPTCPTDRDRGAEPTVDG